MENMCIPYRCYPLQTERTGIGDLVGSYTRDSKTNNAGRSVSHEANGHTRDAGVSVPICWDSVAASGSVVVPNQWLGTGRVIYIIVSYLWWLELVEV